MTVPGRLEFDRKRLTARACRIAFVIVNGKRRGHSIRIHGGDVRGLPPETSENLGETQAVSTGRTRAVLELEPGRVRAPVFGRSARHTRHGRLVLW